MDWLMHIDSSNTFDVVIISRYNPWEGGGLENIAKQQIASLVDKGLHTGIVFRKRKHNEKMSTTATCFTINDYLSRFSGAISDMIYAIPTYIKVSKINTKMVLDNFELPFLYLLFKKGKGRTPIAKVHHGTPNYLHSYEGYRGILAKIYGSFLKPLYSLSSKEVNVNIAVSDKVKKELIQNYDVPAEKIVVINNGIDTNRFKPRDKNVAREKLSIASNKKIILFFGGDLERKGLQETLNIVETLNKDVANVLLLVITPKKVSIDKEWVRVFHNVHFDKLPVLYNASDIYLLPSKYEVGLPLTALEALASSCPAVISPNASEEETNGEGYLIAHNFTEYVTCCRKILEDEKYHTKLGSLGRNLVIREYDKQKQFALYGEIAEEILSTRS
jgi:glycosyltransferase involved in cell wall biosynthesis